MPHQPPEPDITEGETLRLPSARGTGPLTDIIRRPTQVLRGAVVRVPRRIRTVVILVVASALVALSAVNVAFILGNSHAAHTTRPPLAGVTPTSAPLLFGTATAPTAATSPTATPRPVRPTPPPTSVPSIQLPAEHPLPTFCPPATPTPTPVATATLAANATPKPTATLAPTPTPSCVTCPWQFSSQPFTRTQVETALTKAAALYHLPHNLVYGVARLESGWNPYFISCSDDIGLMQLKRGLWQSMDELDVPECGLTATAYDPYDLQQNAYLGAKVLAWLTCFFSYWGGTSGANVANPGGGTIDWYYQQAGMSYPDLTKGGKPNPASFCDAVYHNANNAAYAAVAPSNQQTWSCPYTPKTGDSPLLDVVISAYNQGIGTTINNGIQNQWYVNIVEAYIAQYGQQYGAG